MNLYQVKANDWRTQGLLPVTCSQTFVGNIQKNSGADIAVEKSSEFYHLDEGEVEQCFRR